MEDINTIYHNKLGVAFQWKKNNAKDARKVQIVFRDTGLFLSHQELVQFSKNIKHTKDNCSLCNDCMQNKSYRALLVTSPIPQVTFALNIKELGEIEDLIDGTIFQLNLDYYLSNVCNS